MISSRSFAFLLTASLLLWTFRALAAPVPGPNVVVITIDTLRADHLGCYGYKHIRTPNIDALAADGLRFERAYTVVPVTLPSHTVIFTGTYPMLSGMHDFAANKLGPTQPTLVSGCEVLGRPDDWPAEISAVRRRQDSSILNADVSTTNSLIENK